MSNANGNGNGKHAHDLDFTGVWAVIGLAGGLNIIGRFMASEGMVEIAGPDGKKQKRMITREDIENALVTEKWIMLDRAFTFALIPGSANGQPMLAPISMPFAGAHDGDIPVGIQIANITTTMFFEEMPDPTRKQFMEYAIKGNAAAARLRAANVGVVVAR